MPDLSGCTSFLSCRSSAQISLMVKHAQSTIGQAHLLDTIIDNLEQEVEGPAHPNGKSYYARRTLTYALGEQVCCVTRANS